MTVALFAHVLEPLENFCVCVRDDETVFRKATERALRARRKKSA